jgi:serine/threonine protein kinase
MMSLANWTTRILVAGAKGGDASPDGRSAQSTDDESKGGSTPEGPSLVGSRVGAYLITKRLGAGGVGEVFKGVDEMLKREVAIKVLRDELTADPVFLARFRNEAQLQAKLSHPNVASVHAFLQEGDKQLMVMEFVAGISLDEFVRSGGPVPVRRALEIFRRALDGIDHAHGHGIVHRDIKPANIMLADSGQVKVMDFGIARAMDSQEHLTRIGHVAGTAKAMSPEQIRGKQADVRSDVYSLGIVLYTMLAGRAPFDSSNDLELMKAQLEQAPPSLRGLVDNLPARVEATVMRALEKDPSARFQTVRDFVRAIDACLAEVAPQEPAPSAAGSPLDAATASRTAINPVLQGVKRLPAGSAVRAKDDAKKSRSALANWGWVGAISLAIVALAGGATLLWPLFSPAAKTSVAMLPWPAINPPQPAPPSTSEQTRPQPAVVDAPTAPPAVVASTSSVAPLPNPLTAPALAETAQVANPAPSDAAIPLRTLSIVRLPSSGKAAAAGSDTPHRFQPGERIRLQVKSSDDAHVYCYLQDETHRILRFYPNRFSKSALVKAAEPLEIPGKMRFELVANNLKVLETVACFASARDVAQELPAAVVGTDFAKLPVASLDAVRDAFSRVAAGSLAEGRFGIDVR